MASASDGDIDGFAFDDDVGPMSILLAIAKLVPLGIYLRSGFCKLDLPIVHCDGPLCPLAIGQPATDGCSITGNTAELKAWCENSWVPWMNGLLDAAGIKEVLPFQVTCDAATDYPLLRFIGALEVFGYVMLWVMPRFGGLVFTILMSGALHFHLIFLKEKPAAIGVQVALYAAGIFVMLFGGSSSVPPPQTEAKAEKASAEAAQRYVARLAELRAARARAVGAEDYAKAAEIQPQINQLQATIDTSVPKKKTM